MRIHQSITFLRDVSLHNLDLVELPGNLGLNVLEEEVLLQLLEPLLLAHSPLLPHQEVEAANVGAVGEELVDEDPAEVACAAGDEDILACCCVKYVILTLDIATTNTYRRKIALFPIPALCSPRGVQRSWK